MPSVTSCLLAGQDPERQLAGGLPPGDDAPDELEGPGEGLGRGAGAEGVGGLCHLEDEDPELTDLTQRMDPSGKIRRDLVAQLEASASGAAMWR